MIPLPESGLWRRACWATGQAKQAAPDVLTTDRRPLQGLLDGGPVAAGDLRLVLPPIRGEERLRRLRPPLYNHCNQGASVIDSAHELYASSSMLQ